ncbi:MAG TPA: hypothetical protein PKJ99_04815 [Thermoanaerobaculales bacterium]|nr:hypothetical protein [Thermoanaerobaculales bacterium]HPA81514.1 hypothetical protein [Thermoanaerobaculales bacterium]HQN97091.1 hypothetical protein [Thermoanaerobaculales bacterium]HQP42462.1 hypothetical protein [Thermoanaerobaculales bacterium]
MNDIACDRERELLDGIAVGELSADLRLHAASCAGCSETLLVASFLRREASAAAPAPLPDPAYLWWRAGLERRSAASERATRAITILQRASIVAAALLIVPLLRWGWPHLWRWIGALDPGALVPRLPADAGDPILVIALSAAVLAAIALLDLHGAWTGD